MQWRQPSLSKRAIKKHWSGKEHFLPPSFHINSKPLWSGGWSDYIRHFALASINDSPLGTTDSPQLPGENGNLTNKTLCYSGLSETPPNWIVALYRGRLCAAAAATAGCVKGTKCRWVPRQWLKIKEKTTSAKQRHKNGEIGRQVGVGLGKVCHTHEESLQKHPVLKSPK